MGVLNELDHDKMMFLTVNWIACTLHAYASTGRLSSSNSN